LDAKEKEVIKAETELFLNGWQSHGADMDAAFQIYFDRFLVVSLDEASAGASGCGIDKLFQHIKKLEQLLGINFFDRLTIYYINDEVKSLSEIQPETIIQQTHFSAVDKSDIKPTASIFDNTVETKEALETLWLKPVMNSWLAPHLPLAKA
jgi:hypothetical protein